MSFVIYIFSCFINFGIGLVLAHYSIFERIKRGEEVIWNNKKLKGKVENVS